MDFKAFQRFLLNRGMVYFYTVFIAGYFLLPMASGHRRLYYILVLPAVLMLWRELADFYRGNVLCALLLTFGAYMMASLLWTADFESQAALEAVGYTLSVLTFCVISGYLWIEQATRMDRLAHRATWLAALTTAAHRTTSTLPRVDYQTTVFSRSWLDEDCGRGGLRAGSGGSPWCNAGCIPNGSLTAAPKKPKLPMYRAPSLVQLPDGTILVRHCVLSPHQRHHSPTLHSSVRCQVPKAQKSISEPALGCDEGDVHRSEQHGRFSDRGQGFH